MTNSKKGKGKGKLRTPQVPPSRLQRVIKMLGLEEVFPNLNKVSDGDLQRALARFLHYGECHTEVGVSSENFKLTSLPSVAFSKVKKAPLRSPLMEPYFLTLTLHEVACLSLNLNGVALDEPPADSDDFLGCRFFFRFVAEAVEHGSRLVIMQDEKQSVALLVHIKALRKLQGDPGTALMQVQKSSFLPVFCFGLRSVLPCLNSMWA